MDFKVLFRNLPEELRVYILSFLHPIERAFFGHCRCRDWWYLVKKIQPGFILLPEEVLEYSVKIGHRKLMLAAKSWTKNWTVAIRTAARCGNIELLKEILKFGPPEHASKRKSIPDSREKEYIWRGIQSAALGGQFECIKMLRGLRPDLWRWNLLVFLASREGHFGCLIRMKKAAAADLTAMARKHHCSREGQACRNLQGIIKDYDRMGNSCLRGASAKYHPGCMELAKKWGVTNYLSAIKTASVRGNLRSLKLIRSWGISLRKEMETQKAPPDGKKSQTLQEHLVNIIARKQRSLEKHKPYSPEKAGVYELRVTPTRIIRARYPNKTEYLRYQKHVKRNIRNLQKCLKFLNEWAAEN